MSYADAAHHAPTSSDPVPDQSLLVSDQDAAPNPDAKHVRVATDTDTDANTGQDAAGKSGQGEQSPRQASSKVNDPSAAKPGSNGSELATSIVKKTKKGKKNKKKTATPPSDDHPQQSHDDEQQSSQTQATASKEDETQQQHQQPQGEKSASQEGNVGEAAATEGGDATSQPAHETDRGEIHNRAEAADEGKGEEHGQASEPGGKGFKTELESLSSTSDRPTVSKDLDRKLVDPCKYSVWRRVNGLARVRVSQITCVSQTCPAQTSPPRLNILTERPRTITQKFTRTNRFCNNTWPSSTETTTESSGLPTRECSRNVIARYAKQRSLTLFSCLSTGLSVSTNLATR